MDIEGSVGKLLSQDSSEQGAAEETLTSLFHRDYPQTVLLLSEIVQNVAHTETVRQRAALAFKNAIYAKDTEIKLGRQEAWRSIPEDVRGLAKKNIMEALRTDNGVLGRSVAQCVANIVLAETMHGERHEIIPFLAESVMHPEIKSATKQSCLEAIGYICEEINTQIVKDYSNIILSAVIHAMRIEEPSTEIRYDATTALFSSMDHFRVNFETKHERDRIMTVVRDAAQAGDTRLRTAALQCIIKIMQLYYELMGPHMKDALLEISCQAVTASVPEIVLQGIEFWSTVCEIEINLKFEEARAYDEGRIQNKSPGFTLKYLQSIVPCLLPLLAQQPDGEDGDEWIPSRAASVCLMLVAQCVKKDVLPHVVPFVKQNIRSPHWRFRDAACVAFGSVLEGPEPKHLKDIVNQAYDGVLEMMANAGENVTVRDTAAWIVQRMCQFVSEDVLVRFDITVTSLWRSLTGPPRVVVNVCWALSALAQASYKASQGHGSMLFRYFEPVMKKLWDSATCRPGSDQNNLRTAAFGAVSEFINNSPPEMYPTVGDYLAMVLGQLDGILQKELQFSKIERAQLGEYCQHLLALLQTIIQRLQREHLIQAAEYIFAVCNGILGLYQVGRSLQAEPEAFMCLFVMLEGLDVAFLPFLDHLKAHIMAALKATSYDEHALLNSTLTFVCEICRTFEVTILPWMPEIVQSIWNIIVHVTDVSCLVKPKAVQTLGDIASSLNHHFLGYSFESFQCLRAIAVPPDRDMWLDMLDAILDACLGLINGMKGSEGNALNSDHMKFVVDLITFAATEAASVPDSTILSSAYLIGELCGLFGVNILPHLNRPEFDALLLKGKRSKKDKTKNLCRWAWKELKKLRSCSGNTGSTLSTSYQSELEMA